MKSYLSRILISLSLCSALGAQAQRPAADDKPLIVTKEQKQAIDSGLAWLAANQNKDGSWTGKVGHKINEDYAETREDGHVGVTALACMAFLAGGHLPGRGTYGAVIERGTKFVLSCGKADGYLTHAGTRMYSHAFATLFLAEIFGMTHRDDVREKLQQAVDFIVDTQNKDGGWRYVPFAEASDMSIVVCQVLALRAARNIGIRVPRATIDRAANYVVDSAVKQDYANRSGFNRRRSPSKGSFLYQHEGQTRSSFALTSAGVTALHGVGIYSNDAIRLGLDYLRQEMPSFNSYYGDGHYFFWYGHYYGVQAMYTAGNTSQFNYWKPYFKQVREQIISIQLEDDSWPNYPGPGSAFATAMAVLILEIPYRYLPIFQR
jgi:squalene cyclase